MVAGLLEGKTNKRIAEDLGVSICTVKRHMAKTMNKRGLSTRLELALWEVQKEREQLLRRLEAAESRVRLLERVVAAEARIDSLERTSA